MAFLLNFLFLHHILDEYVSKKKKTEPENSFLSLSYGTFCTPNSNVFLSISRLAHRSLFIHMADALKEHYGCCKHFEESKLINTKKNIHFLFCI